MLSIAERQYDWTSKGHLNVTPYGIVLDFPHSDKEKRGVQVRRCDLSYIGV